MLSFVLGLFSFIVSFALIVFVDSLYSQCVVDLNVLHGLGDLDGFFSQLESVGGGAHKLGLGVLVTSLQVGRVGDQTLLGHTGLLGEKHQLGHVGHQSLLVQFQRFSAFISSSVVHRDAH